MNMKRLILIVFALFVMTVSHAQRMKVTDEPLDHAVLAISMDGTAMANLELKKELNLNDEQYKQVQFLNEKRYQRIKEADNAYKGNSIQRSKAIYSIHMETDKALGQMLDPDQLRKLQELDGRHNTRYATEEQEE